MSGSFKTLTREAHICGPGPKRILAVDGGGVRGIVAVQFLKRIEETLRARFGGDASFRLCDYFDLIIGTSTGAILAAGLSIGRTADEMEKLYDEMAPRVFRRKPWMAFGLLSFLFTAAAVVLIDMYVLLPLPEVRILWIPPILVGIALPLYGFFWASRFDARALTRILERELKDLTLGDNRIRTGLGIISKRVDTDSAWVLTNQPKSHWWETRHDKGGPLVYGNRYYKVSNLVRASTAAPYYFRPERVAIGRRVDGKASRKDSGTFLDGGVTTHNNPSLMALRLAMFKGYGFNWTPGADDILIVSVGTGSWRSVLGQAEGRWVPAAWQAVTALTAMIAESERQVITTMQWLSRALKPIIINSEIGDMRDDHISPTPVCTFVRYDVTLEPKEVSDLLGRTIPIGAIIRMRNMTDVSTMDEARIIAAAAAGQQVQSSDFPSAFDFP